MRRLTALVPLMLLFRELGQRMASMRGRNRAAVHAFGVCATVFVLISTLVLGAEPSASAAVGGTQLWAVSYDSRALYGGIEALSPDGSKVFVTGTGQTAGKVQRGYALIVAYDASTGARLWATRNSGLQPASLSVSPDGSKVFVTGYGGGAAYATSFLTIAYDASTGATLWTRRYDAPNSVTNVASSLSVSPNGSEVFVTGYTVTGYTGSPPRYVPHFETFAYRASTGRTLWARRYPGTATSVAVSPDGSEVFVTGSSATLAYRASTGETLWTSRSPSGFDPRTLAVTPDGSEVFVAGGQYTTLAFDASSGTRLWLRRYGTYNSGPQSLAVSPDGSEVFITGSREGTPSGQYDWATVAYDASNGRTLWVRRYDDWANLDDQAYSVAVSPDGSKVFVTGYKHGDDNPQWETFAYDASTGMRLWDKGYDCAGVGLNIDSAYSVAVGPDGSHVFVSGVCFRTYTPAPGGLTVVAYTA